MTDPTPTRDEAVPTGWRYSINYGPDGEENFANVYAADGQFVGNLRTHHAIAICNAFAVCEKLASAPAPASGRGDAMEVMTCDEQFEEAKRLASNLGYMVVPDPIHLDGEVHEPEFVAQMQPSLRALGFHAVPLSPAATPVSEAGGDDWMERKASREKREAEIMQEYAWGDLTPLGVANYLKRAGFNIDYAVKVSNALAKPATSPAGGDVREALAFVGELEALAFSKQMSQRPLDYEQVQTIFKAVSAIRAALSLSGAPHV